MLELITRRWRGSMNGRLRHHVKCESGSHVSVFAIVSRATSTEDIQVMLLLHSWAGSVVLEKWKLIWQSCDLGWRGCLKLFGCTVLKCLSRWSWLLDNTQPDLHYIRRESWIPELKLDFTQNLGLSHVHYFNAHFPDKLGWQIAPLIFFSMNLCIVLRETKVFVSSLTLVHCVLLRVTFV